MPGGKRFLDVDLSDVSEKMELLRGILTEDSFRRVIYNAFKETTRHTRAKVVPDAVKKEYAVNTGWVKETIRSPKVNFGGGVLAGGVSAEIPLKGPRGDIGKKVGKGFKATGGKPGWAIPPKGYKIRPKIYKSARSTLPHSMPQTDNRPFINTAARSLHNLAFSRAGKERFPIMKVTGIGVPQMPMNKAEPEVRRGIEEYLDKRIDHYIDLMLSKMPK